VARRADHRARHRQRHFADHLRGHRRSPAERVAGTLELGRTGALSTGLIIAVIVVAIAVIAFIVFIERAQRRLLIQYPKRQVGSRMFQGDTSHLPLKLNTAGVIPPIFASSLLLLPATIAGFSNTG
jgi:preprotein translocase subunit SecY